MNELDAALNRIRGDGDDLTLIQREVERLRAELAEAHRHINECGRVAAELRTELAALRPLAESVDPRFTHPATDELRARGFKRINDPRKKSSL